MTKAFHWACVLFIGYPAIGAGYLWAFIVDGFNGGRKLYDDIDSEAVK